ncbi:MAG: FAD:protein FMN transferase [Epsilonproteobacteria bacterium]|nr:FAD:protein FMN transferase [Campylobacterota bacterium]
MLNRGLKVVVVCLILPLLLSSDMVTRNQVIMGTTATISLEERYQKEIQQGFQHLHKIERSLSSYDPHALVYQLNSKKSIEPDRYLLDVLAKSRHFYQLTDGYFDITVGALTKGLYHFGEKERLPSLQAMAQAKVNFYGIVVDKREITLKEGITIDLGGIGKGYGIDQVAEVYDEVNITEGKISLSGDIRCIDPCQFFIQDPFNVQERYFNMQAKIPHLAISTSGTYERYIKSQKNHHLINPKRKKQGQDFVSVTIFTDGDNTKADALATAVSVMPKKEAIAFLQQQGIGYILIAPNAQVISGNLERFIEFDDEIE